MTYTIVLVASLVAVAHAAIFVRMADADPLVTAAYRMLIASAVLLPVAAVTARREILRLNKREWRLIGWAAVFLALHFATWIASLDFTSIANSVVLVTLTPVWLAVWAVVALRQPPGRRTWLAVGLALAGSIVMGSGSARVGLETLFGDGLALAGGILFVGFLLLAEAARRTIGIVAFVTLVYSGAAILLWATVFALDLPVVGLSLETYLAFIGLGLVSQIIGHTGFNWAVRVISPMVLALLFLTEPLLSTALGWFYFGEGFARETAIGGALILAAVYLGVRARGTPITEQTG
ncbi:MAG: DMT family transporter [Rhodospirillaceae bacterium]|nr:DMT family transporter [Rhodospirillaceae bacterium]MBT3932529.1 DMT family transporter [Rhodospirillaceae bacterium]MBT4772310.1 DMT family transporter [Rhodospirillaceae bacterium]MBT5359597.1 DMT family transporter [Rhodospirillaceae bacterium]MBT5768226.1 DMT family transporter [Rhodospirillaceae bacterium]